jgi:hypothetical protein
VLLVSEVLSLVVETSDGELCSVLVVLSLFDAADDELEVTLEVELLSVVASEEVEVLIV